jgi:NADH-quinone oxidoreductase subunit J
MQRILFDIAGVVLIVLAASALLQRNPLHAALLLAVVFAGIALPFLLGGAAMLAMLQIIIYAGAIIVMFIFTITYVGSGWREGIVEDMQRRPVFTAAAGAAGVTVLAALGYAASQLLARPTRSEEGILSANARDFSQQLLTPRFTLPLEIASLILIAAMVAAVVLVLRKPPAEEEP